MEIFCLCLNAKWWTHIWNWTKLQQPINSTRTWILKEQTDISYLVGVMRLKELTGDRCMKVIQLAFMSILNLQNFCKVVDYTDFMRAEATQCNTASHVALYWRCKAILIQVDVQKKSVRDTVSHPSLLRISTSTVRSMDKWIQGWR